MKLKEYEVHALANAAIEEASGDVMEAVKRQEKDFDVAVSVEDWNRMSVANQILYHLVIWYGAKSKLVGVQA